MYKKALVLVLVTEYQVCDNSKEGYRLGRGQEMGVATLFGGRML